MRRLLTLLYLVTLLIAASLAHGQQVATFLPGEDSCITDDLTYAQFQAEYKCTTSGQTIWQTHWFREGDYDREGPIIQLACNQDRSAPYEKSVYDIVQSSTCQCTHFQRHDDTIVESSNCNVAINHWWYIAAEICTE